MKNFLFAFFGLMTFSAFALSSDIGPERIIIFEDGELVHDGDDGYEDYTICIDGVCNNHLDPAKQ